MHNSFFKCKFGGDLAASTRCTASASPIVTLNRKRIGHFSIENHHFSRVIPHSFGIFNRNKQGGKKDGVFVLQFADQRPRAVLSPVSLVLDIDAMAHHGTSNYNNNRPFFNRKASVFRGNSTSSLHFQEKIPGKLGSCIEISTDHRSEGLKERPQVLRVLMIAGAVRGAVPAAHADATHVEPVDPVLHEGALPVQLGGALQVPPRLAEVHGGQPLVGDLDRRIAARTDLD